jgi:hypothetical protein
MGDMRNVAERVSEGRSGSYFYYSHDGKFMVKTVSKDESDCMRAMLPDYYSYVLENPDTLLMRILGLLRPRLLLLLLRLVVSSLPNVTYLLSKRSNVSYLLPKRMMCTSKRRAHIMRPT